MYDTKGTESAKYTWGERYCEFQRQNKIIIRIRMGSKNVARRQGTQASTAREILFKNESGPTIAGATNSAAYSSVQILWTVRVRLSDLVRNVVMDQELA